MSDRIVALMQQAARARREGRLGDARDDLAEAVEICRSLPDTRRLAHTVRHLGDVHQDAGHWELAEPCYQEALLLYRQHDQTSSLDLANAIRSMALLKETIGATPDSMRLWEEAHALYTSVHVEPGVAECSAHLAQLTMPAVPDADVEAQLAAFIDKFEPGHAAIIRECRVALRRLMPTAVELVYDNYNFFVIGYCTTPRASDCIVSIAAAANGVSLSFYYGAALPDPACILQGNGKQNRFIRMAGGATLREPAVRAIIQTAIAHAEPPLPAAGAGRTVIQSVSAKQRPRRSSAATTKGRTA